MNLAGRTEIEALMLSGQKAFQIKYKESWLGLVGNAGYYFSYSVKPDNVIATFKFNNGNIEVYDNKGNKTKEIKGKAAVSQKLSNATDAKISKPSK